METLQPHQSPMAQFNYDATYEHHESHYESSISEPIEGIAFMDWYDHKQMLYASAHDNFRKHLLRESYLKILHYSIYSTSTGIELSESQLILLCSKLFSQFLVTCRH